MRDDERIEWDADERKTLASVGSEWTPPAELRGRVVAGARARGFLAPASGVSRRALFATAVAATLIAFAAGAWIGSRPVASHEKAAPAPPAAAGNTYLLLLYEDARYDTPQDAAAHAARVREYSGWAGKLQKGGRLTGGDELASGGHWLRWNGDELSLEPATPDPARGVLAGYFQIAAASDDEAATIARDCPHLRHRGTIEIRRVAG